MRKTKARLSEDDPCLFRDGRKLVRARIETVLLKGYWVTREDNATRVRLRESQVQPYGVRRSVPLRPDPAAQRPAVVVAARPAPQPVHIEDPPEQCPWWLRWVKTWLCCNCGVGQGVEAHHEGRKGVAQKVRDTKAVPLCSRCHQIYTDENALPLPGAEPKARRTREASLALLRAEQERLLTMYLGKLDQVARIEVLSKALAVSRSARKEST